MNAIRVLFVDDEPDAEFLVKQTFRKHIQDKKLDFVFAHDGIEALERLIDSDNIEIVLSDINMPRMDGLTLLSKISEMDQLLKTIIISAYGDMKNIRTAMNRGAFDFLTKPIDMDDLIITVDRTIDHIKELKAGNRRKGASAFQPRSFTKGDHPEAERGYRDAFQGDRQPRPQGRRVRQASRAEYRILGTRRRRPQDRLFPARHRQGFHSRRDPQQTRQTFA
jgi:YesN/AraC family two-component response regulator